MFEERWFFKIERIVKACTQAHRDFLKCRYYPVFLIRINLFGMRLMVDWGGFEPPTSWMQARHSYR